MSKPNAPASPDNVFRLQAPPFVGVARADAGAIASFLDDEAGIAAYAQTSGPIDLSVVRNEFRTVERETAEYIIGSVGIPDYSEDHDPHVYVHTDGWVLAYYLNSETASYVIDLRHYDGVEMGTTKLEDAIYEILSAIGIISFDTSYYDFRSPNATHIMLIAEAIYDDGNESFDVLLPSDFTYYDKSWTHALHATNGSPDSALYLDDASISELQTSEWVFARDSLSTAQLPAGVPHTISVHLEESYSYPYGTNDLGDAFCGLALVYQEVP